MGEGLKCRVAATPYPAYGLDFVGPASIVPPGNGMDFVGPASIVPPGKG
ncbi:hypothetical protein MUU49_03990 [Scandinavium goeteborgense]|nr:hypothetical protein [Scandinavium goeteborgense]MCS2151745.1 hypothetical protein [Scandinavium goeteborgense]